jgi:O-acetylserine/cysteine efflux transporter
MLGEPLAGSSLAGIVLALAGVATVSIRSGLGSPLGIALLLVAALAWASASIVIKRMGSVDLLRLSCGQMLVGGFPLLVLGIVAEHRLPHFDGAALIWSVFLVIPATAVNFVLWFRLLERYSATAMTSWLFLVPVFGVLSGALFLHEPLSWRILAGGLLVVAGVVLSQRQARREEVVLAAG